MRSNVPDHSPRATAAALSLGAGVIHAVAVGLHADHPASARTFLLLAALQCAFALVLVVAPRPSILLAGALVNLGAVVGWVVTRSVGIGFIAGLETPESPQPLDTVAAASALLSVVVLAIFALRRGVGPRFAAPRVAAPAVVAVALAASWNVSVHDHGHAHEIADVVPSNLVIDSDGVIVGKPVPGSNVASPTHAVTPDQALALASGWPRAFDPSAEVDLSGIDGVTGIQAERARALIAATARALARYSDTAAAGAAGYTSIGDSVTGYEHWVKWDLIDDGRVLDPDAPESLVYRVDGGARILVSAMFIASPGTPMNDAVLADYTGGLMQWHQHTNLCWRTVDGVPRVSGLTLANGKCVFGTATDPLRNAPMVHVWVRSHPCGPFAAVEGVAAGSAGIPEDQRVDLCTASH